MRCPVCWSDKAYLRQLAAWKQAVLSCLLLRPMKCHHCFHKFLKFWPLCIGQRLEPPPMKLYRLPVDAAGHPLRPEYPAPASQRASRRSKAA